MYVHVLLVGAGVDNVLLVVVNLRDVLSGIYMEVVGSRDVLAQRRQLNRFLMVLLNLQMLW